MKSLIFILLTIVSLGCEEKYEYVPKLSVHNIEMCKVTLSNSQTQDNKFYILNNIKGNLVVSESSVQLFLESDAPVNKDLLLFNGNKFDLNKNGAISTSVSFYGEYHLVTQKFGNFVTTYFIYI